MHLLYSIRIFVLSFLLLRWSDSVRDEWKVPPNSGIPTTGCKAMEGDPVAWSVQQTQSGYLFRFSTLAKYGHFVTSAHVKLTFHFFIKFHILT